MQDQAAVAAPGFLEVCSTLGASRLLLVCLGQHAAAAAVAQSNMLQLHYMALKCHTP
jgi:hypothetical protein